MIKELTITQHYDATIEMWNYIAEYSVDKFDTPIYKKYKPKHGCFACELYNKTETLTSCEGCPLETYDGDENIYCEDSGEPYAEWLDSIAVSGNYILGKAFAIEIAQRFIDNYDNILDKK